MAVLWSGVVCVREREKNQLSVLSIPCLILYMSSTQCLYMRLGQRMVGLRGRGEDNFSRRGLTERPVMAAASCSQWMGVPCHCLGLAKCLRWALRSISDPLHASCTGSRELSEEFVGTDQAVTQKGKALCLPICTEASGLAGQPRK